MKLVNKNVVNGVLVSVTVLVDNPDEIAAYRKNKGIETCPTCGKPTAPSDNELKILIMNPLNALIPGVSMDVGQAVTKCSSCGAEVVDSAFCDLSAYPDVAKFVKRLRAAARGIGNGGVRRG